MKKHLFLSLPSLLMVFFVAGQSYVPEKNNTHIKVKPAIGVNAFAFDLKDVRLLDGSPFKNAMDKDAAYLLEIAPERLMHRFYKNAGLPTKGDVYGGWESAGLSGHTLGHYLSACSMMFASTGDVRFKERVTQIVNDLNACQQARKTGYVGAIPNEDTLFARVQRGDIKTSGFDLNGGWSPWYTVHKVMAGLVDAYLYCDDSKALSIAVGMADWTGNILRNLTPEQLQKMLKCEYGGMNDVLANIYSVTGNKKYLDLSYKFYDDFVMKPLSEHIDPMSGKHSNTNVPKAIGSARQYELTGNQSDKTIASFFWDIMIHNYTYVIGGNSNYEYCGDPKKLSEALSDNTCETCCTYNMLKLTRHLFCWQPSSVLGDYYERALYNHILASQNPTNGMMCYFVPLRMGTHKEFSDPFNTFTCCVGSGMENHSKYTENIYYQGRDGSLYVNLFISSRLDWKDKSVVITQHSGYPQMDNTILNIQSKTPKSFTIRIRHPWWATKPAAIVVNGAVVKSSSDSSGFIIISRQWKNNDSISISFPMNLYSESMPDNPSRVALLYGPVVLAGQLGTSMPDPVYGTPVLMTDDHVVTDWAKNDQSHSLEFKLDNVGKPFDVKLKPFYETVNEYYNVYWDYFTNADWTARQSDYEAEKKRQKEIDDQTIDVMRLGEMQPERDHHLQASENSYTSDALGRMGREARSNGFFSFDIKVSADTPNSLLCTYIGDDKNRHFDILIDGQKIASEELKGGQSGKFFDKEYPIPAELIKGKDHVIVRVQPNGNFTAGRMFGCRTLRTVSARKIQ